MAGVSVLDSRWWNVVPSWVTPRMATTGHGHVENGAKGADDHQDEAHCGEIHTWHSVPNCEGQDRANRDHGDCSTEMHDVHLSSDPRELGASEGYACPRGTAP